MNATILGGGKEVGRVAIFNELENERIMVDYGLIPHEPPKYPIESPPIKNAVLTHAHLDHSGMIPWLCSRYNTRVFTTPLTREISEILYRDTLKIADSRGYPFPYGENEIHISSNRFAYVGLNDEFEVNGIKIKFHPAGHIPGSVMVEIKNYGILYACDINTIDTHLLKAAKPVKCETLFIEGTYAGIDHPDRRELEKQFIDEIEDIVNRGGKVIIPAFAVGRTQELAMILHNLGGEVWLDGMGYKISEIILKYKDYINSKKELKKALKEMKIVYSSHGKKLALKSGVVLTTSGMMNGGPVLWYVDKIKDDPKSAVIITGYQVEGTNGRMLLENREIEIHGIVTKVDCQVKFYDFSAHAGHSQLIKFIKDCNPENVIIFHSDNPELIKEEIDANVYIPENGDKIKIGGGALTN